MKKISSIILALVMLCALCIPAFAGEAVDALTNPGAKAFCDAAVDYITQQGDNVNLNNDSVMAEVAAAAAKSVALEEIDTEAKRAEIASLSAAALAADYNISEQLVESLETRILEALTKYYNDNDSDLGFSVFDPTDVVNNVAGNFSDNDLSGLFDTMRNTITDLSDRLSNVFSGLGGDTGDTSDDGNDGDTASSNNNATEFGGSEANGDTAIYAVAGVAAVAAAALVLTKKKSASK